MIETLIGLMVVAYWVKTVPAAIADVITTMRASKAGEWSFIDKERDRKAARAEARRKAWEELRRSRHRRSGGDGTYRPGAMAYLADLYYGFWEDMLEKRHAVPGSRPASRFDEAVERKVQRQRKKTGRLGRIARTLIEPVGEPRPEPEQPKPDTTPQPTDPVSDRPRTACPVCGDTLTERDGAWLHSQPSTCPSNRRPDGGYHVPQRVAEAAAELYQQNLAEGCIGALGETRTARDLRGLFGDQYPQHVYEQAAADAQHVQIDAWWRQETPGPRRPRRCERCEFRWPRENSATCEQCDEAINALRQVADAAWFQVDPDWSRGSDADAEVAELVRENNTHFWTSAEVAQMVKKVRLEATQNNNSSNSNDSTGGDSMNTATGDVHDVESCKNELTALNDDLARVDAALDVIDEAIRQAKAATERIEAWLREKNAEACVPGVSVALDALSADRLKELIDAVEVARQGVLDTIDNLAPLEEAAELVGATDGSALNGR